MNEVETVKKGSFGYLNWKKRISLGKSILFLSAVLVIYFAALHHFQTNKNVFSIVAAVGALPTGRSIVETIMCMRARPASARIQEAVRGLAGLNPADSAFDLYLTAYDNAFSLSHAAVAGRCVYGLTEDPALDRRLCEQHIREMLERGGQKGFTATVFHETDAYLQALAEAGLASPGDVSAEEGAALQTLLAVSL